MKYWKMRYCEPPLCLKDYKTDLSGISRFISQTKMNALVRTHHLRSHVLCFLGVDLGLDSHLGDELNEGTIHLG